MEILENQGLVGFPHLTIKLYHIGFVFVKRENSLKNQGVLWYHFPHE